MLEGNATMREYEDTVKYTENKNMSLKEWKNNELNGLLMKKFGILKEEKKNMVKDPKTGKMVPNYAIDNKGANDLAEEEEELEEGRNNPRTTNSDKFVGHEDRYLADRIHEGEKMKPEKDTDDDKPPKGAPPAAAEEDTKQKTLQEAIKRIARAKKVFLKGKRIK